MAEGLRTEEGSMKHIIQLSSGKDSTEVFYGSIDRQRAGTLGYKIDEVVFLTRAGNSTPYTTMLNV